MTYSSAHHPHLRLAPDSVEHPLLETWAREQVAREAIANENCRAAGEDEANNSKRTGGALDPTDPRWVLAVRAYSQLQGSTLTPERRERVLKTAKRLGVRTFDASVIIAIVQDQARQGRNLDQAQPMLNMIAPPPAAGVRRLAWMRWAVAMLAAGVANAILIWWLTSG